MTPAGCAVIKVVGKPTWDFVPIHGGAGGRIGDLIAGEQRKADKIRSCFELLAVSSREFDYYSSIVAKQRDYSICGIVIVPMPIAESEAGDIIAIRATTGMSTKDGQFASALYCSYIL